jgi:signal transduction histidine kinase/HAMP domain-containing protein
MNPTTTARRPSQIGLASWLGGGSVLVVLLAVAAMAIACAVLLDRVVRQQALVRAQLAATTARELMRRIGEDVLTDTQVLSERPTLLRLLQEGADEQDSGLLPFISRYCESSGNSTCALRAPDGHVIGRGGDVDWEQVATAQREQGERFLYAPRDGRPPWWGAAVRVAGAEGWQAIVLRQADNARIGELGRQVSATLRLTSYRNYHAPPDDPLTPLHSATLSSGSISAQPIAGSEDYGACVLVSTATGEIVALLDARISGREFAAQTKGFNRLLAGIAAIVALIAGVGGLLYGRWLARPVVQLRDVAQRIGRGDLSASVPSVAPLEVGALAHSMDEMRGNLLALTDSLRQREAEARALLHGIVEGVYAVDEQRLIRYVNPQIVRLLARPESEIVGRFCGDVLQPALVEGQRPCERNCPILAARSQGQASLPESLCMTDGSRRSAIIVSAAPVGGMQVQVLRDETELEAVRRARDGVLGNISHEFRTPLAAQLASIELLREGLATMDPGAQAELLENVQRGVLRLMRLIDNLLESVRIESGQLAIRHQQVDLAEVVREAADLMQPLLAQRRLQLDLQLDELGDSIPGDSQRLMQVLVNLLSNAGKFAPEGSAIRIGGRRDESWVELWVDDAGPGVAGDDATTIFERFRRSGGEEPDAPGLGLGLWIVKSIVDRHGGHIGITRTADAHTRFTLRLPLENPT